MNTRHIDGVSSIHHVALLTHHITMLNIASIRTLEVGPIVNVLPLLLHHVIARIVQSRNPRISGIVGLRSLLVHTSLIELKSRLEKHGEQVNEILGATQTSNLLLILLVPLFLLGPSINELFISDESHFLWVAVLHIESILTLEEYISCKIFCHLALVLFLKVNKGLLSARNDLNLCHISLTC